MWLDKQILKFCGLLDRLCEGIERLVIPQPKKRKGKKNGKVSKQISDIEQTIQIGLR